MYERTDLRLQGLDLLRFPLAVMVVVTHTFDPRVIVVGGNPVDTRDGHRLFALVDYIIEAFNNGYSVPIFFFISGFLFFLGVEFTKETYLYKLRKRAKTLLVPYIICNTLAIVLLLCPFLPFFAPAPKVLNFTWTGLLSCFWIYDRSLVINPTANTLARPAVSHSFPILPPMWFLRDLMVVVLLSPLVYWTLKYAKRRALWLLGIAWIVSEYCQSGYTTILLRAFLFFSWGAYMSINGKDLLVFRRYFRLSLWMYLSLGMLGVVSMYRFPMYRFPEWSGVIKDVGFVFGLLLAYDVATWLLQQGICKPHPFLASASFFIYIAHPFLYRRLLVLVFGWTAPCSSVSFVLVYASVAVLTILVLLAAYYLMRRYCPALLQVLTGRG